MSIGQALAEARESRGLSVLDVASATRIRRTLIDAIEADDFAACGGDFYARGHIRSIASVVGIDPAPLLAEFDMWQAAPAPRPTEAVFEPATSPRFDRRGPNWSAAMAAALVVVLVYGAAQAINSLTDNEGSPSADSSPSASAPAQSAKPSTPAPSPTAVAQAPRNKVTVVLRARDLSWVQATTASGKELFQGLVQKGERKTFTDKQRVRLVVGDAGAVVLTVNGTPVGSPGRSGQVARVQFTRQDPTGG